MDKERIILIRILIITSFIPIFIFLHYNISKIEANKKLLARFEQENVSMESLQNEVLDLEKEKSTFSNSIDFQTSLLFSTEKTSFYEFCDFIIESAKNRELSVQDYSTNESMVPQRITISANGTIENTLSFLHHLYTFDKKIDIPKIVVSFNHSKNQYYLFMTANFITQNNHPEE